MAKQVGGYHFSIDRVLDDHGLTDDKEDGYISQKSFKQANTLAIQEVESLLTQGTPVIFDGNFYWKSQVDDLLARLTYPHHVFTLKAPLEVCIERDSARDKTHGKDAARVVYAKSTEFEYGTVIDVTVPLKDSVEVIVSHLNSNT